MVSCTDLTGVTRYDINIGKISLNTYKKIFLETTHSHRALQVERTHATHKSSNKHVISFLNMLNLMST